MVFDIDYKLLFSGLGFVLSLVSLAMAYSARKEARQTIIFDLIHKKRMFLAEYFSEVLRVLSLCEKVTNKDSEYNELYEEVMGYRNDLIEAMNESSEINVDIKKYDKKTLLNQISDNSVVFSMLTPRLGKLESYIEKI